MFNKLLTDSLCDDQRESLMKLLFSFRKKGPYEKHSTGTSLIVQWCNNPPSNAGDAGLIPGWELRSHMPRGN